MDRKDVSSFFGDNVHLDNPQSKEEDEEIEEQKRLQEELEDLLTDGIHAFRYDDSTLNSSICSSEHNLEPINQIIGDTSKNVNVTEAIFKNLEQDYKDAMPKEQLKVLYEIRLKEMESLREEFEKYKIDKDKEMNILKNKVTIYEAELRHTQMSSANLERLLVEKTDIITKLNEKIVESQNQIDSLQKTIEKLNVEICAYSTTVNELQLKACESNPFNKSSRAIQNEEIQRIHEEQIVRLETLLDKQKRQNQILENDKARLEEDLKRVIKAKNEVEEENGLTILRLTKKLHSTQQQCKDLYILGEAIKKESDHFKERLEQGNENLLDASLSQMDHATLVMHVEKLKKLLLDKDKEMNTLIAKQKFYDNDMKELFEYRDILTDARKNDIKPCDVPEHVEQLIILQKQLEHSQMIIEDRNQEIMNLHLVNKESQEKIEEMLKQTRNDIQNLSNRYSLPQLEKMSADLQNAEKTINQLKLELQEKSKSNDELNMLKKDLEKSEKQIENLKQKIKDDNGNYEGILALVKCDVKQAEEEIKRLRQNLNELQESEKSLKKENERLEVNLREALLKINQTDNIKETSKNLELNSLEVQYKEVREQLDQVLVQLERGKLRDNICNENIRILLKLRGKIQKLLNFLEDVSKTDISDYLKDYDNILTKLVNSFKHLASNDNRDKSELDILQEETKDLEIYIDDLAKTYRELSKLKSDNKKLTKQLNEICAKYKECDEKLLGSKQKVEELENVKNDLRKQIDDLEKQLEAAMRSQTPEPTPPPRRRRSLLKEFNNSPKYKENQDSNSKNNDDVLQAALLRAEISMQQKVFEENSEKLRNIEEKYQKVLKERTNSFNKELEELKSSYDKELNSLRLREVAYRKQLAIVLSECSDKVIALENENGDLKVQLVTIVKDCRTIKENANKEIDKYRRQLDELKRVYINKECLGPHLKKYFAVERDCSKALTEIKSNMKKADTEILRIQKIYDDKIQKLRNNFKFN